MLRSGYQNADITTTAQCSVNNEDFAIGKGCSRHSESVRQKFSSQTPQQLRLEKVTAGGQYEWQQISIPYYT